MIIFFLPSTDRSQRPLSEKTINDVFPHASPH